MIEEKIIDMIKFNDIEELSKKYGKNGNKIIWIRDGSHSTCDLQIILEFEKRGFNYKIYNYKGDFEKEAIKVEFVYNGI